MAVQLVYGRDWGVIWGEFCAIVGKGGGSLRPTGHWLVPHARAAAKRRRQLATATGGGIWPGVRTPRQLATALAGTHPEIAHPIDRRQMESVVEGLVATAAAKKELGPFAPIADRAGLIDLLCGAFQELDHARLSPAQQKRLERAANAESQVVSKLHQRYQRLRTEFHLADDATQWRLATEVLQAGSPPMLHGAERIVLEGLRRLSTLEREFYAALASHAGRLVVLVEAPREELLSPAEHFGPLAEVRSRLVEVFPEAQEFSISTEPACWPAGNWLSENLFCDPRTVPAAPPEVAAALAKMEILAAASDQDEAEQIARRVKQMLLGEQAEGRGQRAGPEQIVIAHPNLVSEAARLLDVFAEYGVPVACERAPQLGVTALVRTLLRLLQLVREDWPHAELLAVLVDPLLGGFDGPLAPVGFATARGATEYVVRKLQLAAGRRPLLEAIAARVQYDAQLRDELSGEPDSATFADGVTPAVGGAPTEYVSALGQLTWLAAALEALPTEAEPLAWFDSLMQLAETLGVSELSPLDEAARTQLHSLCAGSDRLARWRKKPMKWSLAQFAENLTRWGERQPLVIPRDEEGRVRLVSPETARHLTMEHLIVMGVSESSFTGRAPNRLLGREFLPAIASESSHASALFRELAIRPQKSLTWSYAALDAKAQELSPSPYLAELARLSGHPPGRVKLGAAPIETPHSGGELRRQAVQTALESRGRHAGLLTGLVSDGRTAAVGRTLWGGLEAIAARGAGEECGAYEGICAAPSVVARLAERFGPEHLWSASQLESYAACPFKFFAQQVLGLREQFELALATDHRRRGALVHEALARLHRELSDELGPGKAHSALNADDFQARLHRALHEAFEASPAPPHERALANIERRQAELWAENYHAQAQAYDERWKELSTPLSPQHFEVRFGPKRRWEESPEDPLAQDEPFVLQIEDEQLRLIGRIDRIDLGAMGDQTLFAVVDYKSGKAHPLKEEELQTGAKLQPVLYALAVEAHLLASGTARPVAVGYWYLKDQGITKTTSRNPYELTSTGLVENPAWAAILAASTQQALRAARGARAGLFPVVSLDKDCTSHCDFSKVCRVGQVRALDKQAPSPEAPPA